MLLLGAALPLLLLSANVVQAQEAATTCYDNLDTVFTELSADDVDLESFKRYVLCPNTVFEIGSLEVGVGIVGGQSPIIPRSNTQFSCGEDGASANSCILRGGDLGVLAFGSLFYDDFFATNVTILGLTFEGQIQNMAAIQQAGDFTFVDCIFQNGLSFAPVLVNYDPTGLSVDEDGPDGATANFRECIFQNNTQRPRELGVEFGVMTIIGVGNTVEIDDSIIRNNMYGDFSVAPVGYAISVGENNALIMKNSCIMGNDFLGAGPLVLNPETFFVLIGNYADPDDFLILCQFAARYPTVEDRDNLNPQCIDAQVEACQASIFEG